MRQHRSALSRAIVVSVLGLVVLLLAALGATSEPGSLVERLDREPAEPPTIGFSPPPQDQEPFEPPLDLEDFDTEPIAPWLGDLLQWLGIIAGALLVVWFVIRVIQQVGPRLSRRAEVAAGTAVEVPEIAEREIVTQFDDAIVSLRSGASVDDAVVECWRRLERLAAEAGIERGATQTTEEFTLSMLAASGVDAGDLRNLAGLYRQAMFSTHHLTDEHRAQALDCLERLRAGLTGGKHAQ